MWVSIPLKKSTKNHHLMMTASKKHTKCYVKHTEPYLVSRKLHNCVGSIFNFPWINYLSYKLPQIHGHYKQKLYLSYKLPQIHGHYKQKLYLQLDSCSSVWTRKKMKKLVISYKEVVDVMIQRAKWTLILYKYWRD